MIKLNLKTISLLVIVIVVSTSAFDNNRNGFILGFAAGCGSNAMSTLLKYKGSTNSGKIEYDPILCFDSKIGCNIFKLFGIMYINRIDFYHPYSILIINNTNSVGLTYYIRKIPPSLFFSTSCGFSLWVYPIDHKWNEEYNGAGFSYTFGSGFEIVKHISLLLEYQHSRPQHTGEIQTNEIDNSGNVVPSKPVAYTQIFNMNTIRLGIQYLFY